MKIYPLYKLGPWLRVLLPFPRARIRVYRIKKTRSCVKRGNGFCLANHETGKSYWHRINHPTVRILVRPLRRRRGKRRNTLKLYGIPADPRMKYQLISILRDSTLIFEIYNLSNFFSSSILLFSLFFAIKKETLMI